MNDGLTLEELASTNGHREHLPDVLREEIAAGRVEVVENGRIEYRLTPTALEDLLPRFQGAASFAAMGRPPVQPCPHSTLALETLVIDKEEP